MNGPQPPSPRHRLKALLAIPDNQRTEAQWDEINELEIMLAPGNRMDAPGSRTDTQGQAGRRNAPAPAGQPKPAGAPQGKKPFKKFHRKPPKGNPP